MSRCFKSCASWWWAKPQEELIQDVTGVVRETCETTFGDECRATRVALQRCAQQRPRLPGQPLVEAYLTGQLSLLTKLHEGVLKMLKPL